MGGLLSVKNVGVRIGEQVLLHNVNLEIGAGEVHVVVGPNGAGKSTLGYFLAGRPEYESVGGSVLWEGVDFLELLPEERARRGLFMAFQNPVALPGVTNLQFLQSVMNVKREGLGLPALTLAGCLGLVKGVMKRVGMELSFLRRYVNAGFSGGEMKRNELLQMLLLKPRLVICDELDSGLDADSMRLLGKVIGELRDGGTAFIIFTHSDRLLDSVGVDSVHVLQKGRIVCTGGTDLAVRVLREGYDGLG